jgi:Mn2+/Fe2+ NRAMP family transporter
LMGSIGALLNFTPIDPIKALFWSAVVNGVVAAPVMVMMMLMGRRKAVMGTFLLSKTLAGFGWAATAVMAVAAVSMFVFWGG